MNVEQSRISGCGSMVSIYHMVRQSAFWNDIYVHSIVAFYIYGPHWRPTIRLSILDNRASPFPSILEWHEYTTQAVSERRVISSLYARSENVFAAKSQDYHRLWGWSRLQASTACLPAPPRDWLRVLIISSKRPYACCQKCEKHNNRIGVHFGRGVMTSSACMPADL
jgi:hypothetical protein